MRERRNYRRTHIYKDAKLFGSGHLADCVVREISAGGARLLMVSTKPLPEAFDLSFDAARTLRSCRVVWRTATEIGLQFQDRSFRATTA